MERSRQETSSRLRSPATAGDVMRPACAALEPNDHLAAAAYLMKPKGATATRRVIPGQDGECQGYPAAGFGEVGGGGVGPDLLKHEPDGDQREYGEEYHVRAQ
jgi:hypothetical protein